MSCRSAYCLFTVFVFCLLPSLAWADSSQDIRAAYVQLDAAYSRRDVPEVMAFLAPGFTRREWNAVLTSAQYEAELKDSLTGTALVKVTTKIQTLGVQGDSADALVSRRMDLTLPQPLPQLPPPYFAIKVTQEHWRRIQGKWRMTVRDDTPLYKTLCVLNECDQGIRRLAIDRPKDPAVAVAMRQTDASNQTRLKQIIQRSGWPGFDLAGTGGTNIAWEIVQHSDNDPTFQKKCLPLIEAAVKRGQEMPSDAAYLTDRILLGEHKPHIYGTQWRVPIADPAHVDERRAAVGLIPLAVYEAQLKQVYQPKLKP